jgi:hypothetical protein
MEKMFVGVSLMMKGKWLKGVTKMKTKIAVLTFLICIVMVTTAVKADVLLSTNGDFSGGTHVGNGGNVMPLLWDNWNSLLAGWGNSTADADYNTGGYVVAKIDATNAIGGYAVVYQSPRMSLAAFGIPEGILPFTFKFSADINDLIPGGGGPGAILKLECYDACGVCTNPNPTSCGDERQIAVSGSTWANYVETFTIPTTTKSVAFVFGVSTGWGAPYPTKPSSFAFDNLRIGFTPDETPALYPVPIIGAAWDPANKVISWTNPEGAVSADVYLQVSTTPIGSPDPRASGTRIAHNTTAQTLTVPSIVANRYYYWVVDVSMGTVVVPGLIWDFQTAEAPPTVNAGADQYLVATASPMTLTLNATATDDHGIATYAWTNTTVAADKDPFTTVTINSPTTEDTTVTLTNTEPNHTVTGYYQFTLTVTDTASQATADTVVVGVYGTCAAAAIADPNDPYDGAGDFNGDCKVDLYDFDLFADRWLDCDSLRIACP